MCTVLLPPGDNPIAVNKYITYIISWCAVVTPLCSGYQVYFQQIPNLCFWFRIGGRSWEIHS